GLYVQNLKENVDFIIQELEAEDGRLYTTVPYVKSAPKAGYQLAYLSLAGIPQLLHAKLATRERCFKMEDETSIIAELPSVDFRNAGNLTGFSGSIGGVREVRSLQQMFRAIPIRIGRYHLKKLEEQPSLLLPNQRKLHEKILELLVANDQPILIVSRKIEDAQAIYDYLNEQQKGSLANKHLKCITGQESETSRQRWLYDKSGIGHSAGNEHCVTIATQICGRGTDIHVTHDKGLLVILTDVLGSRNLCQNKGRAARAGHPGSFIALYNAAQLQREWSHLNLPRLAQETISTWVTQIQKEMLFVNSSERLRFSGEAWYHHHLSHFLAKALRNNPPATIKNAQTKLRALLESKSTHDTQFESHKRIATEIWDELLSYLVVLGIELVSEHFGAEAFKKSLSSSEQWQTIVSPSDDDTFFRNHAKGIPAPTIDDAPQSKPKSNHEQKLLELRKRLQSMPLLNHKQTHWYDGVINWFFNRLAWFNPSSQKLKQALAQDWDTFNTTPSFENWSVFYSTLLSAEYLQKKQAESWIWRIDYWFKSWNPLGPWCEFKNNAEKEFNSLFSEARKNADPIGDVIGAVAENVKNKYAILLRPFSEKKEGLVFNIMRGIYPETYDILNQTYQAWLVLQTNPRHENKRQGFRTQLTKLNIFYQTHYANSFWPFSYWKDYFQLWQSVYSDFEKTTIETPQLPKDLIEWQAETQAKSHKRLLYLGHLMCQEQIHTYDFRFYCNFFGSSGFLSKMQEQYESTHNNGDLELKIDELSRYFPQQLKIIFKQLHPDFEITDTDRDVIKKLCHEILQRYVLRPEDGVKISIPLIDKKCQVLLAELEQWQESRELIPDHCL
ncbi:MAG: hypothetical protein EBY16_05710, partial [Gammaproteobacteria bacterium]|nr:hypothetical protein [Gammaproteobacteria bacterium]